MATTVTYKSTCPRQVSFPSVKFPVQARHLCSSPPLSPFPVEPNSRKAGFWLFLPSLRWPGSGLEGKHRLLLQRSQSSFTNESLPPVTGSPGQQVVA